MGCDNSQMNKHISPVLASQETRFLVTVVHWTKISPDDFKGSALSDVIVCHFKHTEVEIGDWRERAAGYEDDGGPRGI